MNLEAQISFLRELDKLKSVLRQAVLVNGERRENTAEHSWHVTLAAITLSEYADEPVDVFRVVKMLLVHDIVEIDAGDTYAFDTAGHVDKLEREQKAAARIFGLLPDGQGDALKALWEEFEDAETSDAKFANAMDQIMPFLHNVWTDGRDNWRRLKPPYEQVYERYQRRVGGGSAVLWDYVQKMLDVALANGWLEKGDSAE